MFGFENALLAAVGAGLITLPILIHLINMMRHRRIEWAAMEFLLESRRKNSTYVMLKQLLLLLLRMLAIAAVAMILGRLVLESDAVSTGPTHHVVLLDDSFSLGEKLPDGAIVFDRGKQAIQELVSRVSQKSRQKVTLWRTSKPSPDVNDRGATSEFSLEMRSTLERMRPSEMSAPLGPALTELNKRMAGGPSEKRIIYVVSDFRQSDWEAPDEIVESLRKFHVDGGEVVLVNCVESSRPNLALSDLRLIPGLLAAGVPAQVEVAVKNFGSDPARGVSIELQDDDEIRPQRPQFETIPPGGTQTLLFESYFQDAGAHRITAKLSPDALEIDNTRRLVIDVPLSSPVLLIDGDERNLAEAQAVADVLQPGGTINIGISPQIEPPSYLMNNDVAKFDAIYLFNLKLLPDSSIAKIEKYLKDGGKVCIFAGDQTDAAWSNQKLYRNGEGFFPAPLSAPADLIVDKLNRAPDLKITDHPIFRFFAGERNSSIEAVSIRRYFAIDPRWKPKADSGVEVICRLRNNAPLAMESRYGKGQVVTFFTTADADWNNWRVDVSYPITILEVQRRLASSGEREPIRFVGTPITIKAPKTDYLPDMALVPPGQKEVSDIKKAEDVGDFYTTTFPTAEAGYYEVRLKKENGDDERRVYAYNVPADEGNLKPASREMISNRLQGVPYQLQQSDRLQDIVGQAAEQPLWEIVLYILVALLVCEQLLAYFVSYHPTPAGGRT